MKQARPQRKLMLYLPLAALIIALIIAFFIEMSKLFYPPWLEYL